jgi:hypothetical protein
MIIEAFGKPGIWSLPMAVITYPHCKYATSAPDKRISQRTRWGLCPMCGTGFEFVGREGDAEEKKSIATPCFIVSAFSLSPSIHTFDDLFIYSGLSAEWAFYLLW